MKNKFIILVFIAFNVYCDIVLADTPKLKDTQTLSDLNIFYDKTVNKKEYIDTSRFHISEESFTFFNLASDKIGKNEVEIQYNYGYNYTTKDDECIALIKPSNANMAGGLRVASSYCILQKYCLENNGKWKLDFASSIHDNIELTTTTNKEIKNVNILHGGECDGIDGNFYCLSYMYKILNNGKLLKVFEENGKTTLMYLQRHMEQTTSYQKGDTIEINYTLEDAGKYDEKKDSITMTAVKQIYLFDHADSKKIYYQNVKVKFKIQLVADRFRYYDYKIETSMESTGE